MSVGGSVPRLNVNNADDDIDQLAKSLTRIICQAELNLGRNDHTGE